MVMMMVMVMSAAAVMIVVMVVVSAAAVIIVVMVMVMPTAAVIIIVFGDGLPAVFVEYHTDLIHNQNLLFLGGCFVDGFHFDIPEELPAATAEEKNALFDAFIAKTRNHFDTLPTQTRKLQCRI